LKVTHELHETTAVVALSLTVSHSCCFVGNAVLLSPENGDGMLSRIVDICLLVYTAP